ncbi:helix-turn-helix domain-containing protein [Gilvimarinus agarilyticus]|uniref:helix-turn-helix domain-containing protein n=1 Tax=Gilvimarinus agarilyticus TaxID=679259 RepID=UPI00059F7311|nr:helix-turn-helix domain-containing protein [Gilvimarinus agarilyticus]
MSAAARSKTSQSGTRVLRVLDALKGHSLTGVSNGELAKALGESPATVNRVLNTLIEAGFAIRLDNGRFAHSVKLLQIAQAHANEMARSQSRINELSQRVAAGAH